MAQILNTPTASERMAANIGNPIIQSLQNLSQMQLKNIEAQRKRQDVFAGLSAFMSPEKAQLLSGLPDDLLRAIMPEVNKRSGIDNIMKYVQMLGFGNQGNVPEDNINTSVQQQAGPEMVGQYGIPNMPEGASMGNMYGVANRPGLLNLPGMPNVTGDLSQDVPQGENNMPRELSKKEKQDQEDKQRVAKTYLETLIQSGGNLDKATEAANAERERNLKRSNERSRIQAQTRKEIEGETKAYTQAKKLNPKIVETVKAAQSGELRAGNVQQLMDKVGLGKFLRNRNTEAGQKALASYALGVVSAFGKGMGRIIQKEFEIFVESNADKFNTPEAIDYIGQLNLLQNKIGSKRYRERLNIINDNDGEIPIDIDLQVDRRTKRFAEEVRNQMHILNRHFSTGQLPKWNNKDYNPARYEDGARLMYNKKTPLVLRKGMWQLDYNKLKD